VYAIGFRPRQTRKQYHSLPQKGHGRVRYQRYEERGGLRKGDIVRVKGKWVKQINAIYAPSSRLVGLFGNIYSKGGQRFFP